MQYSERKWMCVSSLHQLKLPGDWAIECSEYYQCPVLQQQQPGAATLGSPSISIS